MIVNGKYTECPNCKEPAGESIACSKCDCVLLDNGPLLDIAISLGRLDNDDLLYLRGIVDSMIKQNRPKPKFECGVTLWHKVWKQRVRGWYDDNYKNVNHWDDERNEWMYENKYGPPDMGSESTSTMYESDLEEYKNQDEIEQKEEFSEKEEAILAQSHLLDKVEKDLWRTLGDVVVVFHDGKVLAMGHTAEETVSRIPKDKKSLPLVVRNLSEDGGMSDFDMGEFNKEE
jgi:hypothetical protein